MKHLRFFLLALLLGLAASVSAAETRPNIIFILLDNVGQEWFGCYGSQENCTPNIDKLAAGGVRFQHCYATPLCSTSRVELLTGRYAFHTGWRFHHDAGIYGGGNFDWRREVTFARVLRDAGYATCIAGKWQINNFNEPGQADCLREHGFQDYLITPGAQNDSKYWDPLLIENGQSSMRTGGYGPDLFNEFVIDFMRRKRDQPFLVYYPITLVHTPLPPTPRTKGQTMTPLENFAENMRYADLCIGRIVAALDELKLRDRTIVYVSGDNGGPGQFPGRTDHGLVRGSMGSFSEPSVDMAMVVNGPGLIPPGRVAPLTDYSDVLPTMAELAHAPLPAGVTIDGHSTAAWLLGQAPTYTREWVHTFFNDERVVRDGRFKLYSSGGFYDLPADALEKNDLTASTEPAMVAARQRLEGVLKAMPPDPPLLFEPQSSAARKWREQKAAGESTLLKRR
jgi:arylsulfatase A-like enzyme